VIDEGPGIAPDLLGKVFERGMRGRHDVPARAWACTFVRLAMRSQAGASTCARATKGTVFTLVVPQGLEPA